MDNTEKLNNALRLTYALYRNSEDEITMRYLAHYLNYDLAQLKKDILSLKEEMNKKQDEE